MADTTQSITRLVGDRIAEFRRSRNWSHAELACRLQVAPETVHRLECGTSTPSLQMLENLAAALNVSISDLIVERPAALDDQAVQISAWLSALEAADQTLVTGVIQQLCERMRERRDKH